MFSKSWARNKNHCFQCDLSVLNMRFKIAERFNTNKEHQSVSPFFHSRLFQFRLHKIYLYIFDQAFELTAQRLDIARYRYSYRRLWFLQFSAATIRFVGWKIGSTTLLAQTSQLVSQSVSHLSNQKLESKQGDGGTILLAQSCSCILSFWRGFNSLIRTIRIKLSSSSFQKSGLSPILSSKVRWWSPTLGSLNTPLTCQ